MDNLFLSIDVTTPLCPLDLGGEINEDAIGNKPGQDDSFADSVGPSLALEQAFDSMPRKTGRGHDQNQSDEHCKIR